MILVVLYEQVHSLTQPCILSVCFVRPWKLDLLDYYHGRPQLFWKGGGGGQDRARGRHLTAAYTLSTFGRFNQWGGGGGGGGGGVLSAFGRFNQWGGGGG